MSTKNVILKDKNGNQLAPATIAEQVSYDATHNIKQALGLASGHATTANNAADMTDTTRIYVYTGSESGYTAGNWYYYNGSAWVSGGAYTDGLQFETDTTLSESGKAADAKVTGDEIYDVKGDLVQAINYTGKIFNLTPVVGYSISANVGGKVTFLENSSRMYYTFKSANDFIISNTSGYRVAFIVADSNNKCVSNSGWQWNIDLSVETNSAYTYYILCDFTNESYSPKVYVESELNDYLKSQLSTFPIWESGSIIPSNGNKKSDTLSIRTVKPIYFKGAVRVYIDDSIYRVRIFEYNADGSYSKAFNWLYSSSKVDLNPNKKYILQISTTDSSTIDLEEALENVTIAKIDESLSIWKDYIDNKVNVINSYLTDGKDKTAFLFLTDTHWNENTTQLNSYGFNTLLMRYVKERCNIDYLIHGGDLNSEYRSNKNTARQLMTKPMEMMRSVFNNVLVTRGNHDDNIEGAYNVWDYVITQSDSYSYMFRNIKNVVFGETGTYFYHDIPFEKVRVISLDCVDMVYSNTVDATKCDQKILAYGYTQLQWLCNVLKDTPKGYQIIIFTHAMLAPSIVTIDFPSTSPQTRAKNYLVVCDLLKAFKNRENYSFDMTGYFSTVHQDYYDGVLSGDFTDCESEIIAVFSGHEHIDCIEEILDSNGEGIGIYNTCTQNSSAMFESSVISSSYQNQMTIGTTTELVWDVVIIDRKNKRVDMIRIGASGEDEIREFSYN